MSLCYMCVHVICTPSCLLVASLQEALIKALKAFGRASHYTLLARGQVVEVLSELHQQVHASMLMQFTC